MPIAVVDGENFNARFEGNGYTIANLYNVDAYHSGLFASIGGNASIRAVGIIDSDVRCTNSDGIVGILVGENKGGTIIASHATGSTAGLEEYSNIGGLVGINGTNGTIIASYATGSVNGRDGNGDNAGGLVGRNSGTIIASYATGSVNGRDGNDDNAGGLVGDNRGEIIASYATGNADGGAGNSDTAGSLVGANTSSGTITASYGFGALTGGGTSDTHGAPPGGITAAIALTLRPTPARSGMPPQDDTMDAWDFGDTARNRPPSALPTTMARMEPTTTATMFPATLPGGVDDYVCGTTLIPGQER